MRICIVYDCLYPHTVGGAERWYRNLAERLAAEGHAVTYLTMRQWERGEPPAIPGVEVRAVAPRMSLYTGARRRIAPPLVFGAGVLAQLLRRGRRYDVVHTAAFPYFSVLAAALARRVHRYRLLVDWHELWTREYWREYLGRFGGAIGFAVQRLCVRIPHDAFCLSRLHLARLEDEGFRGRAVRIEGLYFGSDEPPSALPAEPVVVFAGRLIPEKRAPALVPAIAAARELVPELRCTIYGDGPERSEVLARIAAEGLDGVVEAPGFVSGDRVEQALRTAACLVLPSRREGYGLVVIEAASMGTPSVVVSGPDNAAIELVEDGVNGVVSPSASARDLSMAIVRVWEAGPALRESTADWFVENVPRLSLARALATVSRAYAATGEPAAAAESAACT